MFDVFGSIKGLLKIQSVDIDNNIFRLHYKATVIILIAFCLLVTSRQYIGDPIDCIVEGIPANIMDTYCWIHPTFTIPDRLATEIVGRDVPHPGIRNKQEGDQIKFHKYYQWVAYVLFFQTILFYIPRYLWKAWEGGKIKSLMADLNFIIIDEETKNKRKKILVDYFVNNLHDHNFYAFKFFFCEFLNLINVIGQIYFMDYFLGGEFTTYGSDVIGMTWMEPEERVDPMSKVFPKVTKCTIHKYGPSGTTQRVDGLCVLPVNIVNEKIYVFLWFWFIIVAIVTGLFLIYRLAVLFGSQLRMHLLRTEARLASGNEVELVADKCQIGDWFVLLLLGKNINPFVFKEIICDLASRFEGKKDVD